MSETPFQRLGDRGVVYQSYDVSAMHRVISAVIPSIQRTPSKGEACL